MMKRTKTLGGALLALVLMNASGYASIKAIVGGTVVNPGGKPTIENAAVLIEGNRIVKIGTARRVSIPKDAEIIDARGKWIIPGLIDSHIHFFQSGGLYTRPDVIDLTRYVPYVEEELAGIREQLPDTFARYLRCGITSVIDVGGPYWNFDVREMARQTRLAPRVAVCGPLISTYQPEELTTDDPPILKVHTVEEALDEVHKQIEMKTDFIKIWYIIRSGHTPGEYFDLVKAIVDESHRLGARVIVHASQLETARAAVEAGADILAHGVKYEIVDDDFVRLLKDRDVIYSTTLIVNEGYMEVLSKQVGLNEAELAWANPDIVSTLFDLRHLPEDADPKRDSAWVERRKQGLANTQQNLKIMQDAGVTIAANTDAGNIGALHGPSLFREFELMAESGLSPSQILTAATINNAKFLGWEEDLGTIEKNKLADLVVLNSNPLADIGNTSDIHLVVKDGHVFRPEEIIGNDAEDVVQQQVNAFNARNIDAFLATCSPDIEIYEHPDRLLYSGREEMRKHYQPIFEGNPNLHIQIVERIVTGDYVIEQERVSGLQDQDVQQTTAIYCIRGGRVQKRWLIGEQKPTG